MLEVDIPSRGWLCLEYLVLDVNGTIGNGVNDAARMQRAVLGIAVLSGLSERSLRLLWALDFGRAQGPKRVLQQPASCGCST